MSATRDALEGFDGVAIVGAGQIGTVIGLGLRAADVGEVAVVDRDGAVAGRCVELGGADVALERTEQVLDRDVVILATPVPAIVAFLDEHGRRLRSGSLLIDTGSTKTMVVEAMRRSVRADVHAIGGHPIAGTERPGPDGADPSTLRGAIFALCPVRDDARAIALGSAIAEALHARPLVLDAALHDRIVARTSALPHLLSFALAHATRTLGADASTLAGSGYQGAVRLARSDPEMVAGLIATNAAQSRAALDELRDALDELAAHLDDPAALATALARARG